MDYAEYIKPELLSLIPVLYALGIWIKNTKCLDWKIPFIVLGFGVGLSLLYLFSIMDLPDAKAVALLLFTGITQGVLVAGASVFANQLYRQSTTGRLEDEGYAARFDKSKIL